ncbi:MAG: class I SAM-dependent methyltransferase [Actinomycetota bacterium]
MRRALRRCEVRPTDVFVDFGSGKGRVVWQAAQYPFARVVGVEISPQLNAVARRNIEVNLDRLICHNVELITADAADFEVPDDMTFAYFYSPFEGKVFQGVIRRIIESVDSQPAVAHPHLRQPGPGRRGAGDRQVRVRRRGQGA